MKIFTLALLCTLACACSQKSSESSQNEVQSLITRAETCIHFSGEFNGDQSDRDKEITAEMNQLKCASIDKELLKAKVKYKNNPELLKSLVEASANY